jgi:hemolysin III
MGWGIILAIKPLYNNVPLSSVVMLIVGGLFYSVGVIFYVRKKSRYMHSIWHLFVIGGSVFHWFAILNALMN